MAKYILKRLVLLIPVILGTVLIVFFIMSQSDVDPAVIILGDGANEETITELRKEMGLDDPFFVRYARYVAGLTKGDMGESYTYRTPVAKEIAMRLPNTFLLAFSGVFLQIVIGIPIGVIAAKRQYGIFDNVSMVASLFFAAAPVFWMGLLFVLVFSVNLRLLPASGMGTGFFGVIKTLILPSFALGLGGVASTVRVTRASMLEVIRQDYIDTARAKGSTELVITTKHMLKNALIPVVTSIGLHFGVLLGGSVLTETIFAWPGIGRYVIEAIKAQDVPSVLGCVVSLSIMFTIINLLVDILYAYIDPRIKAQYKSARG